VVQIFHVIKFLPFIGMKKQSLEYVKARKP